MRFILYSGFLAAALMLSGCASEPTYDLRGPVDICEIHHEFMHAVVVTNTKAPLPSQEYMEARAKGFIHAKPFFLPDQCTKAVVNICDDCVRAEEMWKFKHPAGK